MANVPEFINLGTPPNENPSTFPYFGNVGPPYMATLSLPGFTIGLPIWLFSTSLAPNTPTVPPQPNASPQQSSPSQHHQPSVDPLPSSPNISSSVSSSSPGKILDASNHVAKKKKGNKKKKNKKKQDKKELNQPTMVVSVICVEETSNMHHKPKYPCRLCKGDHFLINCPGIPKVLEVWSEKSHQLSIDPSTSDSQVPRKKGKVRFPCKLCKGSHQTHIFPHMDEASKLLENLTVPQQEFPTGYRKLLPNLPSTDEVIDVISSTVDPTFPLESETHVTQVDDPLVDQVVDSISHSIDPTFSLESEHHTAQVLFVTSDSSTPGGISPVSTEPPPSTEVFSFDWNRLTEPRLPSSIPFQIIVKAGGRDMHRTQVDEGASVSILSSTAWKALGSPQLVPITQNLKAFNRTISEPLGILPKFSITLEGKTVCIDLMVVRGPLDFNLLLGRDYVYAMKAVVSTLFRVMSFPHNGNIVTVDQLSFPSLVSTTDNMTTLNVPDSKVVSTPPRVNYVATDPMFSVTNVSEPLTVFSPSFYLDPVIDMENSMGLFERDVLIPFESLDMCSFQRTILPSDEDLLEAMIKVCPLTCLSSSWKP